MNRSLILLGLLAALSACGDGQPLFADQDRDGIADDQDDDDNGNGIPDDQEGGGGIPGVDTDDDGIPDDRDPDDDSDGIPDVSERDSDGDGLIDDRDIDDDNDGVLDTEEDRASGADTDGDGIPNDRDLDDDSDGIPDNAERDSDGDGLIDDLDLDDDNDSIPDTEEDDPGRTDTDGDGIPDTTDPDDDNDGIRDTAERDLDGDGLIDDRDVDDDNDGILDTDEDDNIVIDTDGDGVPDDRDPDDDNDGIADTAERDSDGDGLIDDRDIDDDNDGILDAREVDSDGDGLINDNDPDDDNDGVPDSEEGDGGIGGGPTLPPGTDQPTRTGSIVRYEAQDDSGSGYVTSVTANPNGTFTVDNLAFDGENIYTLSDGPVQVLSTPDGRASYAVYESQETVPDTQTGAEVDQLAYRMVYGRSDTLGPNGEPTTQFAIVRTGDYIEYGFGGFVYERNGGVELPTEGQATFSGDYAGMRVMAGPGSPGGLEDVNYVTGDVVINIDFADFNAGSGVDGRISDRVYQDVNGNVIDDLPDTDLTFRIGPGTVSASGEMSNGAGSTFGGEVYEAGTYYAIIAGDDADEIVGIVVVDSDDPRYTDVTARETGGFIVYR